jgi:beta-glucosidase
MKKTIILSAAVLFSVVCYAQKTDRPVYLDPNAPVEAAKDADKHEWVAEPGKFKALLGSSSEDVRSTVNFKLN